MDTDGAAVIGSLCSKIVKFYMQNDFSRTLFSIWSPNKLLIKLQSAMFLIYVLSLKMIIHNTNDVIR